MALACHGVRFCPVLTDLDEGQPIFRNIGVIANNAILLANVNSFTD